MENGADALGLWGRLPRDVRRLVMSYMGSAELSRLARCSAAIRQLADDESLWKALYVQRGGSEGQPVLETFKQSFVQRFGPLEQCAAPSRLSLSSLVPSVLSSKLARAKPKCKVLMLGLDGAGKSTILCKWGVECRIVSHPPSADQLKLGEVVMPCQTVGFNVETIECEHICLSVWDLGGAGPIRPLWREFFDNSEAVEAIVFVVYSCNANRLQEAAIELHDLLGDTRLRDAVLLVLAHKAVRGKKGVACKHSQCLLQNVHAAMPVDEVGAGSNSRPSVVRAGLQRGTGRGCARACGGWRVRFSPLGGGGDSGASELLQLVSSRNAFCRVEVANA